MSEDSGPKPAPLILYVSILKEVARGDVGVMSLLLGYDAEGQSLIIPVLAVTAASADMSSDDAAAALAGLGRLGNVVTAPLANISQAVRLAEVISRTELDPWDAQVAMIADVSVCPILTAKWELPDIWISGGAAAIITGVIITGSHRRQEVVGASRQGKLDAVSTFRMSCVGGTG